MGIHTEAVQKLYVAYFSRPADTAGLVYWEGVVAAANGDTAAVSAAFAASDEYLAAYAGLTPYQVINAVYQNLFGREADVAGLNFWGQLLLTGTLGIDRIVTDIAAGAQGADLEAFNNKVAAATAFTASLDTSAEMLGYSGAQANAAAKAWLAGITTDASLESATAPAALDATVGAISDTGLSAAGQHFTLTTGIDTFTGGAGNDTFEAVLSVTGSTLTALDTLHGGAGTDTLRIDAPTGLSELPAVTVSDIENVVVRSGTYIHADVSSWNGVEKLAVTQAGGPVDLRASASTDIDVTLDVVAELGATVSTFGGKDIKVKLGNVGAGSAISVGGGAAGSVNIDVTTAAAGASGFALADIAVTGGSTINVVQNVNTSTVGVTGKSVITQADVTVTGTAATTSVALVQSATAEAEAFVPDAAEVHETHTLKFSALAAGSTVTVGGISFTASKDLTAAEVANAFAHLADNASALRDATQGGGTVAHGVYEGSLNDWSSGAAVGDTVTFTATLAGPRPDLGFGSGVSLVATVDGVHEAGNAGQAGVAAGHVLISDAGNSIKTVTLDGFASANLDTGFAKLETLNLSNADATVTVADTADTLALNLEKMGSDTAPAALYFTKAPATLNVNVADLNVVDMFGAGIETLHVGGTGELDVYLGGVSGLKTIKVTDAASLYVGDVTLAATSIDASGTSGFVGVTFAGDVTTYAGGAGVDFVAVDGATGAITKAIDLGDGDDILNLFELSASKLAATTATIDGGAGTDLLLLNSAAAQTLSASPAFEGKISGFERLALSPVASDTTVNLDNLDDINYVIVTGQAAGWPDGLELIGSTAGVTGVPGNPGVKAQYTVSVNSLMQGQSYTVGGLTVTPTTIAGMTAAEVAQALQAGTSVLLGSVSGTLDEDWEVVSVSGEEITFQAKAAGPAVFPTPTKSFSYPAGGSPVDAGLHQDVEGVAGTDAVPGVTASYEYAVSALEQGQSLQISGLTVTATGPASATDVAAVLRSGIAAGNLEVSGALAGWTTGGTGSTLVLTSTTADTPVAEPVTDAWGASGGTLTLDNMTSGATIALEGDNTLFVNLKDASGAADEINLLAGDTYAFVTTSGVETVNVTVTGDSGYLTLDAAGATTVRIDGDGDYLAFFLGSTSKDVKLVDASAAESELTIVGSSAKDAVAVTIKGGEGDDYLVSRGDKADVLQGGAGNDQLVAGKGMTKLIGGEGNDLFVVETASKTVNSYATIMDFEAGDLIQFDGVDTFNAIQIELGDTAVFQDYANAAVNALGDGEMGWFVFGGNTYLVADMDGDSDNGFVDGDDFIVKIVGEFDLSKASFNADYGTIGLV